MNKTFVSLFIIFPLMLHAAENANTKPNILLITADDLGFDDLSIHNNPIVKTPHIDSLARKSVQFSDFSVSPVCATTRASLLTGRHYYKTGVSGVHGGRDFLNKEETLLSDVLSKNGYATGTWGKWHLGKTEGYFPWNRGFDEAYYAELYEHQNSYGFFNGEYVEHNKWVSDAVTDYAIEFIQKSAANKKPFFAYLSYLAPHEPWIAPEQFVKPYISLGKRPAIANLYGMISEMDFHIGRLLAFLEKAGLSDNTVIIFLSDNGPWWDSTNFGALTQSEWVERNPSALKGNKGQSWQNGVRSPLFVSYGKHFKAQNVERFVNIQDLFPTILSLTQTPLPSDNKPIDGVSFLNYLKGDYSDTTNREIYLGSHDLDSSKANFNQWTPFDEDARAGVELKKQRTAYRNERYKLLLNHSSVNSRYPKAIDNFMLFDMQKDPLESTNIIEQEPEVAKLMMQNLERSFAAFNNDHHSLSTPVYEINNNFPVSVVNGFGPSDTMGNTTSKAHALSNMKAKGDAALYDLDIQTSGCFDLHVKQRNTDAAGLNIKISVDETTFDLSLNGELNQYIGQLKLKQGPSLMRLEVIESKSMKSWAQISGLRRFLFTPCKVPLDKKKLQFPH